MGSALLTQDRERNDKERKDSSKDDKYINPYQPSLDNLLPFLLFDNINKAEVYYLGTFFAISKKFISAETVDVPRRVWWRSCTLFARFVLLISWNHDYKQCLSPVYKLFIFNTDGCVFRIINPNQNDEHGSIEKGDIKANLLSKGWITLKISQKMSEIPKEILKNSISCTAFLTSILPLGRRRNRWGSCGPYCWDWSPRDLFGRWTLRVVRMCAHLWASCDPDIVL